MVYFFQSKPFETSQPHWIITGKDKYENDMLIKHGYRNLNYYWFHVDKYSSGHVYLKLLPEEKSLDDVPREIILDCLQLCKSESAYGNKLPQCTIIATPWHNLRKSGYMKPGEVSFKTMKSIKKMECFSRDNKILNRLQKSRIEIVEDVESLLHAAKVSKDGEFFTAFLEANREELIRAESERRRLKKQQKRLKKMEDDQCYNDDREDSAEDAIE